VFLVNIKEKTSRIVLLLLLEEKRESQCHYHVDCGDGDARGFLDSISRCRGETWLRTQKPMHEQQQLFSLRVRQEEERDSPFSSLSCHREGTFCLLLKETHTRTADAKRLFFGECVCMLQGGFEGNRIKICRPCVPVQATRGTCPMSRSTFFRLGFYGRPPYTPSTHYTRMFFLA